MHLPRGRLAKTRLSPTTSLAAHYSLGALCRPTGRKSPAARKDLTPALSHKKKVFGVRVGTREILDCTLAGLLGATPKKGCCEESRTAQKSFLRVAQLRLPVFCLPAKKTKKESAACAGREEKKEERKKT